MPVWDATGPIDNNAKAFGDLRLYEGFLKCLYTEGMIGAVAGYFSFPKGGFDAAFSPGKSPQYLVQMVILGRVHAAFSHQEAFLRRGSPAAGPKMHAKVTDQPAYEFPTGQPNRRVLARKMPGERKWLITAWAAGGVGDRQPWGIPDRAGDPRKRGPSAASTRLRHARWQTGSTAGGCRLSVSMNTLVIVPVENSRATKIEHAMETD